MDDTRITLEQLSIKCSDLSIKRLDVKRCTHGALAWSIAHSCVNDPTARFVVLVNDVDSAREFASNIDFFLGTHDPLASSTQDSAQRVLVLPASEHTPFAAMATDRGVTMQKLATLFALSESARWQVLCLPVAALVRKVIPKDALVRRGELVQVEEILERDKLIAALDEGGYLRVPVVEDPGTFAVRGAVIDVWTPSSEFPARIEVEEDLCLSVKLFDPEGQRTVASVRELYLHPVREALLGRDERARARVAMTALCDPLDLAHQKVLRIIEDVESGRSYVGADGLLPAYYERLDSILDYLPAQCRWVLLDPAALRRTLVAETDASIRDRLERTERRDPCFLPDQLYLSETQIARTLTGASVLISHSLAVRAPSEPSADVTPSEPWKWTEALEFVAPTSVVFDTGAVPLDRLAAEIRQLRAERGKHDALLPLVDHVKYWHTEGFRTVITGRTASQAERVAALLRAHDVDARLMLDAPRWTNQLPSGVAIRGPETDEPGAAPRPTVEVIVGDLSGGMVLPSAKIAFVTEEEIFGTRARKTRRVRKDDSARKSKAFIDDLRSLSVGDFVVHIDHGIGRYLGLEHRKVGVTETDLLVLEYAGGDRLFLPVARLNQVQKWSGGDGSPKLDRLGGSTFAKSKAKVEREVRQMADELLRLYAERRAHPGRSFATPGALFSEFEATFAFEETDDQRRAIDEVMADLQRPVPMDRLVCGDVGFGKTEVAVRAAFHVAAEGAQVAILCPTTVLAQQHFHTFSERFRSYPLNVAVLSRFVSPAKQKSTLEGLKKGTVDVVIGTHRLLSKDVQFKDLGLLVVDEEQRFGVTHKEKIKQLRARLDVLTLSATPIPRTLQMAVSGLRELSLITTPPVDRRSVRTVVSSDDPSLLKEAVLRELGRGGQIFYVYNRVEGLYERAERLQKLVPSARVAVAHGQMNAEALETVMTDFVEGRYDALCSTAIIESGIDIPRANTMIVDRADLFGLSQLYQIRGRVGRSRERAYCYLLVPPPSKLSDEARQRIEAIEKFTELGAGFHVATLDMELRGAGDLLGGEQSGNVAQVGFDLYVQMLESAVADLKGEPIAPAVETELSFDDAYYLPAEYIDDVGLRLSLYKRFASASNDDLVADLADEMEDRFGPPPSPARMFVRVMAIKANLRPLRAMGIEGRRDRVVLHLREDSPVDGAKIAELCASKNARWKLTPDLRLSRRFDHGDGVSNAERALIELQEICLN